MMRDFSVRFCLAVICGALLLSAAPPMGTAGGPHHLVYRFGYNGPAADTGNQTGTTTIDLVGLASDGGFTVNMLDEWWHQARPRQQYTCEVYAGGTVKCNTPPNAISPIQATILPLLAPHFFAPLASNPNANWTANATLRATFLPGAGGGFAGQVYTWKCVWQFAGQGVVPNAAPDILIHRTGTMNQQGGRLIRINQDTKIAYDPRIHIPVVVGETVTVVPTVNTNRYVVNLRLIQKATN